MRKKLNRIVRLMRGNNYENVVSPTPIAEELSAMGVVNAIAQGNQPATVDLSEIVKARTYARYGHLAYVNTFR